LDVALAAERTVRLLRDPDLRDRFGRADRAFAAEHFSLERMVAQINDVYLVLAARKGVTARLDAATTGERRGQRR